MSELNFENWFDDSDFQGVVVERLISFGDEILEYGQTTFVSRLSGKELIKTIFERSIYEKDCSCIPVFSKSNESKINQLQEDVESLKNVVNQFLQHTSGQAIYNFMNPTKELAQKVLKEIEERSV